MPQVPEPPSQKDALAELFGSSRRDFVPLRKTFLQQRDEDKNPIPGPFADLVKRGVPSTINQLLLLHARAAGRPLVEGLNYDVAFTSRVWARLLDLPDDDASLRMIGRNWAALRELKLVTTRRVGRTIVATPLREDGSGEPYSHPKETKDAYLKIPYAFWLDGLASGLRVPALALVLIARSTTDWFPLPFNKGPAWYGIAASTVERGLRDLRRADLIEANFTWRKTPLSDSGWTKDMRYRLKSPLGPIGTVSKSAPPELLSQNPADASPSLQTDSSEEEVALAP
jgi:hypothetical protein